MGVRIDAAEPAALVEMAGRRGMPPGLVLRLALRALDGAWQAQSARTGAACWCGPWVAGGEAVRTKAAVFPVPGIGIRLAVLALAPIAAHFAARRLLEPDVWPQERLSDRITKCSELSPKGNGTRPKLLHSHASGEKKGCLP